MIDCVNETVNQLIEVLKANALSISGVEVELDNLKDEIRNQKNSIDTNEISIMNLTASVNSIREAIKEREAVTVYIPQTNVSQPMFYNISSVIHSKYRSISYQVLRYFTSSTAIFHIKYCGISHHVLRYFTSSTAVICIEY